MQRGFQFLRVVLRGARTEFGVPTGAEAVRQRRADVDLVGGLDFVEGLGVGPVRFGVEVRDGGREELTARGD